MDKNIENEIEKEDNKEKDNNKMEEEIDKQYTPANNGNQNAEDSNAKSTDNTSNQTLENIEQNNEIKNDENEKKMEIEAEKENDKNDDNNNDNKDEENQNNNEDEKEDIPHERSPLSLEGAKPPLSLYTRRVMDTSKIEEYLNPDSSRGQCGGQNLGNTCFMNSSIACISNCTELTYYFLKGDYKNDINKENNFGMHGELAESWANLLRQYWVEKTDVGDPSDFKAIIGQKAHRFRGYGQQDSNEFMSVFLDYLNEDLNAATIKEYIELNEKGENETDEECAKRFWDCNLRRNDSIITDLFCGQFKSTITCPDCNIINITFDPFDTVNLPLLTQKKTNYFNEILEKFDFFYIPKYNMRNGYQITIKNINKNIMFQDVIKRIKKENDFIYKDLLEELFMVDMLRKTKYGYAKENEAIYTLMEKNDTLYLITKRIVKTE